ncbi:hypothetical protein [Cesiribacter sp. SM1]|uniref:hypothetical protein n=1 Tax=Cesiribacter sp. SM1 TaxID=2861196 RepID=UPI001CD609EE|nr:hypothetical protein [Cesiribacter sp. SM1]
MRKHNWTPESKAKMVAKQLATKKERGYHTVKFTYEQAQQMRHLSKNRVYTNVEIMKMFNVCKPTFYAILKGEIYSESNPTHLKAMPNFGE